MSSWWDAVTSYLTVHAEEKQEEDDDKEEGSEGGEGEEQSKEEGEEEEEGGEEEAEEEEEDEPQDPKPALVEHATNHLCPAEKYHFDECAARVAKALEHPDEHHHGHAEDCAEEFLHLMHCVDKQIAEPLFRQLK